MDDAAVSISVEIQCWKFDAHIIEGGLEDRAYEISEEEERVFMRLEMALLDRQANLKAGIVDARHNKYVDALQAQADQIRKAGSAMNY